MARKVGLVTGSNKGIGFATVRGVAKKLDGDVFLTSRNVERGQKALEKLVNEEGLQNVKFHQLDIDDEASVIKMRDDIKEKYGGLDILVNNGAIAFKNAATEPFAHQAEVTVTTNYFNTKRVCDILFPILNPGARVVNVSSSAGWLARMIPGKELKEKFSSEDLTYAALDEMMKDFIESAKSGNHGEKGWPNTTYGVSKVGLSALSRLQQREFDSKHPEKDIVVNHVHPGYVDTDMTSHKGPRTLEEGARSSIYGAFLPPKTEVRGAYIWEDCTLKNWVQGE